MAQWSALDREHPRSRCQVGCSAAETEGDTMDRPKHVGDAMTRDVATLTENDRLTIADDVMSLGRIRHMPVVDASTQEVVGLVSQRDLFRGALARAFGYGTVAQSKLLRTLSVKDVMTREPVTIAPDASLRDAARLMIDRKIGCLPVVEERRLVGILTEADFVALEARS
jgi:CBS domain-containing membrane protein